MSNYTAKVEDGAMVEAPVYEAHKRGKNWMATITADPAAPGGLARTFVKTGRGRYYYIVDASLVGKAVEIAGDYISGGGNRSRNRWYGVVRSVTDSAISIERCAGSRAAILAARTPVHNDHDALVEERARLQARIDEIDEALAGVDIDDIPEPVYDSGEGEE